MRARYGLGPARHIERLATLPASVPSFRVRRRRSGPLSGSATFRPRGRVDTRGAGIRQGHCAGTAWPSASRMTRAPGRRRARRSGTTPKARRFRARDGAGPRLDLDPDVVGRLGDLGHPRPAARCMGHAQGDVALVEPHIRVHRREEDGRVLDQQERDDAEDERNGREPAHPIGADRAFRLQRPTPVLIRVIGRRRTVLRDRITTLYGPSEIKPLCWQPSSGGPFASRSNAS